jgi:peroxiredoxin Q/BCP
MAAKKKKSAKKSPKKKVSKKKATKKITKAAKKSGKKKASKKVLKKKATKKSAKKATTAKKATKKASKKVATPKKAPKVAKPTISVAHPLLNTPVPDVAVYNQRGEAVNLREAAQGKRNLVLYFYPKDDTPGCTKEACNFRDNLNRLQAKDTLILGVSPDDAESHQKFIEKYQINFDLLSDTEKNLANLFQVWKEKEFMGNKYWGVDRSTFLFSDGVLTHVWQPVKVDGHVDEVLSKLG